MSSRAFMAYDIENQIADTEGKTAGKVYEKEISLTYTQIRALNTAPVELIAAPGPNKIIEFMSAMLFLDHDGGSDYGTGGNIVIRTVTSGVEVTVSGTLTSAASLMLSHDNYAMITVKNAAILLAADADEALELYCDTAHTTGTSPARIKIMYRILDFN